MLNAKYSPTSVTPMRCHRKSCCGQRHTSNAKAVGLRRVIGKDMVTKVYKVLREKRVTIDQATWNRRYREYTEKIKTGSVLEIAEVLRDLFMLKGDKELSFGERKMLDTARNLLVKELAIASAMERRKNIRQAQRDELEAARKLAAQMAQANEMMELRLEAMNNSRKTLELTASEADPPTPRQISASS